MSSSEVRVRLSEDGADAQRLASITGFLRQELLQLDVEDVTALRIGDAPPGAKAVDAVAVGGLLVNLGSHAGSLGAVVSAVRKWLKRTPGVSRTVRLEIAGEFLELSAASAAEQGRLIDLFVQRHGDPVGT